MPEGCDRVRSQMRETDYQSSLDVIPILGHFESLANGNSSYLVPIHLLVLVGLLAHRNNHHIDRQAPNGPFDLEIWNLWHFSPPEDVAVYKLSINGLQNVGAEEIFTNVFPGQRILAVCDTDQYFKTWF